MKEITDAVAELYDAHPFPHSNVLLDKLPVIYCLDELLLGLGSRPEIQGTRLLDVGCGTGEAILTCARAFPEVEITAIDLSEQALGSARCLAKSHNIKNINFVQADVLDFSTIPGKAYDIITARGSMHHLADPSGGMRNLVKVLRPSGVCAMSFYNKHGRADWEGLRQAMRILGASHDDEGISKVRSLKEFFITGPDSFLSSALLDKDTFITDSFLHPQVHEYDVHSLNLFLQEAKLTPRRFLLNDHPLGVPKFPKGFPHSLKKEILQLPQKKRDLFMELVERPSLFHCYAQRPPHTKPPVFDDWHSCKPLLPSFLRLETMQYRGEGVSYWLHTPNKRLPLDSLDWSVLTSASGKKTCREIAAKIAGEQTMQDNLHCIKQWVSRNLLYLLP